MVATSGVYSTAIGIRGSHLVSKHYSSSWDLTNILMFTSKGRSTYAAIKALSYSAVVNMNSVELTEYDCYWSREALVLEQRKVLFLTTCAIQAAGRGVSAPNVRSIISSALRAERDAIMLDPGYDGWKLPLLTMANNYLRKDIEGFYPSVASLGYWLSDVFDIDV